MDRGINESICGQENELRDESTNQSVDRRINV